MKDYVTAIAYFFHNAKLAIALLTDREYDALSAEATRWYYDEIKFYPIKESQLELFTS